MIGLLKSSEQAKQGGLAASTSAQQNEPLASLDFEGYVLDHALRAKGF